jgi:hypothetical protein
MLITHSTHKYKSNGPPCEMIPLPSSEHKFLVYRSTEEVNHGLPMFSQFIEPIEDEI